MQPSFRFALESPVLVLCISTAKKQPSNCRIAPFHGHNAKQVMVMNDQMQREQMPWFSGNCSRFRNEATSSNCVEILRYSSGRTFDRGRHPEQACTIARKWPKKNLKLSLVFVHTTFTCQDNFSRYKDQQNDTRLHHSVYKARK